MKISSDEYRRQREESLKWCRLLLVLVCALAVAGSTLLHYLYAYSVPPTGTRFEGILVNP